MDIKDLINAVGLELLQLRLGFFGLLGGTVVALRNKKGWIASFISIVTGAIVSASLAPYLGEFLALSHNGTSALGFLLGVLGMKIVDLIQDTNLKELPYIKKHFGNKKAN